MQQKSSMDAKMLDKYKYPVKLFSALDYIQVVQEEYGDSLDKAKVETVAEFFMQMLLRVKYDRSKEDFAEIEKICRDEAILAFFRKIVASSGGGREVVRGWTKALLATPQSAPITSYDTSVKDHLNNPPDDNIWKKVWPWLGAHLNLLTAAHTDENGDCMIKESGSILDLVLYVTASLGFKVRRDNHRLKPHSHLLVFPMKCFPKALIEDNLLPLVEKIATEETSESINQKL